MPKKKTEDLESEEPQEPDEDPGIVLETTPDNWEGQKPCPWCGGRKGRNPATGIHLKFWDAGRDKFVEGHHHSCKLVIEGTA